MSSQQRHMSHIKFLVITFGHVLCLFCKKIEILNLKKKGGEHKVDVVISSGRFITLRAEL